MGKFLKGLAQVKYYLVLNDFFKFLISNTNTVWSLGMLWWIQPDWIGCFVCCCSAGISLKALIFKQFYEMSFCFRYTPSMLLWWIRSRPLSLRVQNWHWMLIVACMIYVLLNSSHKNFWKLFCCLDLSPWILILQWEGPFLTTWSSYSGQLLWFFQAR